ncbi:MAG: ABC transporter permease [Steroidobacteraceae bacterium]
MSAPLDTLDAMPVGPAAAGRVSMLRIFGIETWTEYLRLLRTPSFSVPVIGFPLLFYLLFGVILGSAHAGAAAGRAVLAAFIVFGVMAPGLFGLGVTLAIDRDRGLLALKRALPMPPGVFLAAKLAVAMVIATIISVLLMVFAVVIGRVALGLVECCALLALAMLGVVPFCGLGLLIGTLTKGQAAAAVINLVYLPMSFLSGVLLPLSVLPHGLARLAPLWPAYHLAQLAFAVVSRGSPLQPGRAAGHVVVLAGMTALFFAIARRRLQRQG